jgi:hypothetical protein
MLSWDITDRNLLVQSSMQKTPLTLKKEAAYFSETLVLDILNYLYKLSISKGQIFSKIRLTVSK